MCTFFYLLIIAVSTAGGPSGAIAPLTQDHFDSDLLPEIEVLAPHYIEGQIDSLNMVQGITVFGEKGDDAVQNYATYRRALHTLSVFFGEYALYVVLGIMTAAVGAVALTRIVRSHHIHLAHQHRLSQLHEYYLWRKAFLEKQYQEKIARRS
jgi:hypothetical protein